MLQIGGVQTFVGPGVTIITTGALGDPSQGVATGGKRTVESSVLANERDLFTLASSPINIVSLRKELDGYDPQKASAILEGFTLGFALHYSG